MNEPNGTGWTPSNHPGARQATWWSVAVVEPVLVLDHERDRAAVERRLGGGMYQDRRVDVS
jgi:hypothetical protein